MRDSLSKSISSLNGNKLNGMMAEIDFRQHIVTLKRAAYRRPAGFLEARALLVSGIGRRLFRS
ncbi:hypothetical protein [Mesorhizobium sp. J18]|uniref:hypothetical protein n=1 Tax=Mesorhizobium sp. J18 TaxID=935263 RepID=UPI0011A2E48E|nr:hypothetical protein [Mesorhizobium sp. J18]